MLRGLAYLAVSHQSERVRASFYASKSEFRGLAFSLPSELIYKPFKHLPDDQLSPKASTQPGVVGSRFLNSGYWSILSSCRCSSGAFIPNCRRNIV